MNANKKDNIKHLSDCSLHGDFDKVPKGIECDCGGYEVRQEFVDLINKPVLQAILFESRELLKLYMDAKVEGLYDRKVYFLDESSIFCIDDITNRTQLISKKNGIEGTDLGIMNPYERHSYTANILYITHNVFCK